MTTRRKLLTTAAAVAILAGLMCVAAFLLFHSFDTIGSSSPLRFLVDREIRNLPLPEPTSSIVFRSEPADGNKPQLDGASIQVSDAEKALSATRTYFSRLGYSEKEGGALLVKPQIEVRLARTGIDGIIVTKYSWR